MLMPACFRLQREIEATTSEKFRAEESLKRNEGRDRRVAERARQRRDQLTVKLEALKRAERKLAALSTKQKSTDRLRIF